MTREEKARLVRELKEKLTRSKGFILTTYIGLDAPQMTDLRRQMRREGLELRVIKNRLFARALKEAGYDGELVRRLKGPLAVVFSYEEGTEAPKIVYRLRKDFEVLSLLWGVVDGRLYEGAELEEIAKLPSRQELMGHFVGSLLAPVYELVNLVNATLWEFTGVLEAVIEKQGGASAQKGGTEMATQKVQELYEALKGLTLLELKQLTDMFKEEFGVTAAAPIAIAAPGVAPGAPPAEAPPAEEEKTEFKVILKAVGDQKLQVIKAIREVVSGIGLKEAKDLVEKAPTVIKDGIGKEEAQQIKEKLEGVGATVEIE